MDKEAYIYALKLLARKDYFTEELLGALSRKFPNAETPAYAAERFSPVIAQLLADSYLDDNRSFNSFVRSRASEGYGPYYIREKLRGKGIKADISEIYEAIEAAEIDIDDVMRQAVQKYIRTKKSKKKDKAAFVRSIMSYMAYRGFPAGESLNIIKSEVDKNESDFS